MDISPNRKKRSDELRSLRIEKGITQQKLSQISGLHRATIARIEEGKIGWNVDSEFVYFETLIKL